MTNVDNLLLCIERLEEFMMRHADEAWATRLHRIRRESAHAPQELKQRVLDMYKGTMGSLRDLIMSRVNGHSVDDEPAANAELDRMVQELWERATAL